MTRIYFSVTNDLTSDQRVHRIITTLCGQGAYVTLTGRRLANSKPLEAREYKTCRMRLLFSKGFLFYACFNVRLFFYLMTRRHIDMLVANDLDTLPANYLVSVIRRKTLIYDSHEYFTEVPELIGRENVKKFWTRIEERIVPKLKYAYTVSQPIADAYTSKYNIPFEVIHNYPLKEKKLSDYKLPFEKGEHKIIIYQGAVNIGRGLELLIDCIKEIDGVKLLIAGDGDILKSLEKKIIEMNLTEKVFFTGKIPFQQLHALSKQADAGVSLEEDLGLNYRYAMPNKLFDYIQAGIPVLVSDLPEMKKVVDKYKIGMIAVSRNKKEVINLLNLVLFDEDKRQEWKKGLKQAAEDLCWENEQMKLIEIYNKAGLKR